jgi:tetratricopeptide (TPR) repeat protein
MRSLLHTTTSFILKFSLPATAFFVPLLFLPITADFFTPHKRLLLLIMAALITLSWAVRSVLQRQIRLNGGPAMIGVLILAGGYIASAMFQSTNELEALRGPVSTIVSLSLIYLAASSTLSSGKHLNRVLAALLASLTIASLWQIVGYLGLSEGFGPAWLNSRVFNPLGGPLPLLTFALPLVPAGLYLGFKSGQPLLKILGFLGGLSGLAAAGMAIDLMFFAKQAPLLVLPVSVGWVTAVEIFKTARTALLGTGPNSFQTTFSQLKPASLNLGDFWNIRFASSSNEYFHILTTTGIVGLIGFVWAGWNSFLKHFSNKAKALKRPESVALRLALGISLLVLFAVPANLNLQMLTFILITLVAIDLKSSDQSSDVVLSLFAAKLVKAEKTELSSPKSESRGTEIMPWVLLLLVIGLIIGAFVLHAPAYAARQVYYRSLLAAADNDATQTYNLQIRAIELNPYEANYRIRYSRTNLAIADAIAGRNDLSDQDRSNITQLIQQSIREAKAATTLDPLSSLAWANLAEIYQQLINVAEGADEWAIAAYVRAIQVDPANPQLRLNLGSAYLAMGRYEEASQLFNQAVRLKSNWANGYYNLAAAQSQLGNLPQAVLAMRYTVQLLDESSPDYSRAQQELAALEAELAAQQQEAEDAESEVPAPEGSESSTEPLITPSINPLELPDGSLINLDPTPANQE